MHGVREGCRVRGLRRGAGARKGCLGYIGVE